MENTQTSLKSDIDPKVKEALKNHVGWYVLEDPVFDYKCLKSKRIELGLTQEDVAIHCHASVNTISAIECGVFTPRTPLFIKLCYFLKLDPFELCHYKDPSWRIIGKNGKYI